MARTRSEAAKSCYKLGNCSVCNQFRKIFKDKEICMSCVRRKGKPPEGKPPKAKIRLVPRTASGHQETPGLTVVIPPGLCAQLSAIAAEELRSPQNQAIWIVKQAVKDVYPPGSSVPVVLGKVA